MRRPSPVPGLEAIPTCQTGIILFPVWRYESGRIPGLPVPVRCRSGLFVPVCQHASSSPLRCAHVPVLSPHSASPLNSLSSTAPLRTIPPYSAQSSPARHHSVAFKATTSFCQIRPRHLSFLPDYPAGTPHCVAPTCPAIFHTFRQHPDRRILPHSTPFPLTKTGDTEQSYPGRFDKRNRPQSRHFRETSHSQHGAIFPNRFIRKAPPGYAIMQKEVFPPIA